MESSEPVGQPDPAEDVPPAQPVPDPNLPEEGDDPEQFDEEPIAPGEFDDPEKADADDTVDNAEKLDHPSAGVEQAPGQPPTQQSEGDADGNGS